MSEMDAQEQRARIDQHLADIELKLEQARQLRGVNYDAKTQQLRYEPWKLVVLGFGAAGAWSALLVALLHWR
jgi:hypothetical protein